MAHVDGPDACPAEEFQPDLFGEQLEPSYTDVPSLRAEIGAVLDKARAAPSEPWAASDVAHLRNIFARMSEGLPAAEAAQLRQELDVELARLSA